MKIIKTKILPLFLSVVLVSTLSLAPKQEAQAVAVSSTLAVVSAVLLSLGLAVNYADLLGHEPTTEADAQSVLTSISTSMNLHDNGLGGVFISLVSGVVKGSISIAQATWQRLKSWAGSDESLTLTNSKEVGFDSDNFIVETLSNMGYGITSADMVKLREKSFPNAKISCFYDSDGSAYLYAPTDTQELHFVTLKAENTKRAQINFSNCVGSLFYESIKNRVDNYDLNLDSLFLKYEKDSNWIYYGAPMIIKENTNVSIMRIFKNNVSSAQFPTVSQLHYVNFTGEGMYFVTGDPNKVSGSGWLDIVSKPFGGIASFYYGKKEVYAGAYDYRKFNEIFSNSIMTDTRASTVFQQYYPMLFDGTFDVITSGRTAKPIIDAPTDGTAPVYRIDGDVKITIPDDIVMKEAVKQVVNGTKSVTETLPLIDVIPIDTALDKTITIPTTDTDVLYPSIPTTKEEVVTVPITIEQAITVTQKMPTSYTFDLRDLFPFCLPFDLYNLYKVFQAEPVAPSFDWDLPVGYENGEVQFATYNINLNMFDEVAFWVRRLELIAFIVGLIYVTRDKFIRS